MKILLIGYGKMGQAIEAFIKKGGSHSILQVIKSKNELNEFCCNKNNVDLAIEFTTPSSAFENIICCLEVGFPIVSGTTGWLTNKSQADLLCNKLNGTFFFSTNFSLAVAAYINACKSMSWLLDIKANFDVDIREVHHKEKKDTPSGTSISIAEAIISNCNLKTSWFPSFCQDENIISIKSKREGKVLGSHTTLFKNEYEEIAITHKVLSREAFVSGVMIVAEWLVNSKKSGVLSMDDFLLSLISK